MNAKLAESDREAARSRAAERLGRHRWSPALRSVLGRLRRGAVPAYLVGGTVRDVLLERASEGAYDVATPLPPDQVLAGFAHVVPLGLAHGTVLILEDGLKIESTTFRREGTYPDARHPARVEFTIEPLTDLKRRDLTVNAMAFDPISGTLLDPHGGALDLEHRVLRAVGDPRARFHEDALRPLRVARLAATLVMAPETHTREALGSALERARLIALERVRDELDKLLAAARPSIGIDLMHGSGLLEVWLPELARCHGVPQNRFHAYDVYHHSLHVCDAAPRTNLRVRWAALLHDIGKPATRVERNGDGTFYNHQFVGAELADARLAQLRLAVDERFAIVHLVREHMFDYRPEWSDGALRRWLRRVGVSAVDDLLALREADVMGTGKNIKPRDDLSAMRSRIAGLIEASRALGVTDLEVDGNDVMRVLSVPSGPHVRAALEALLEEVLDHPQRNVRARLLERLEQWRGEHANPEASS